MTSAVSSLCRLALATGALALAGGAALAAPALDLYYERALMSAADARCRLFEPQLGAALASAQAQARGAALRAGATEDAIAQTKKVAVARAGSVACASADLTVAAGRVRAAFQSFSRLQRMTYAGELAPWKAVRVASANAVTWRLSQGAIMGRDKAVLGLAASGRLAPGLAVAGGFSDGSWPYSARLVLRDPARSPRAQIGRIAIDPKAKVPLAQRLPPRAGVRVIMPEARTLADPALAPTGIKAAILFRFPVAAADLIEALDPREAVAVEFLFADRDRDQVRTAYFEVGDFSAGRAFLRVPAR